MNAPTYRYMPLSEVLASTGLSKTKLYERIKNGDFPVQITLSKQCVRWRSDEVAAWMERQSDNRNIGQSERSEKARVAAKKSVETRHIKPANQDGGRTASSLINSSNV